MSCRRRSQLVSTLVISVCLFLFSSNQSPVFAADFIGPKMPAKIVGPQKIAKIQTLKSTSLDSQKIFDLINAHRAKIDLPSFETDTKLCEIAASRGPELSAEAASGDFHSGLYKRNLPFWITENMKYGADEEGTVAWWLSSSLHRHAIEGTYKYACGECTGNACIMLFTNWQPK